MAKGKDAHKKKIETLTKSFEKWSSRTNLVFVDVNSSYADIQITFGEYVYEIIDPHINGIYNKNKFLFIH